MMKTLSPEQKEHRDQYIAKFDELLASQPSKLLADELDELQALSIDYTSIAQRAATQGAVVSLFFGLNLKPMKNVSLPAKLFLIALPLPVFFGYHYIRDYAKYDSYKLYLATKYIDQNQILQKTTAK
jgi:hypothetical protein